MRCHKTYFIRGVEFESWIGPTGGGQDCTVKAGNERLLFLRVRSYRGDRGALDFRAETAYAGPLKQLYFLPPNSPESPEWKLLTKLISGFADFTERAELLPRHPVGLTGTVFAIIEDCNYLPDFRIQNKSLDLDVDL
jgi:hypothetical protein